MDNAFCVEMVYRGSVYEDREYEDCYGGEDDDWPGTKVGMWCWTWPRHCPTRG